MRACLFHLLSAVFEQLHLNVFLFIGHLDRCVAGSVAYDILESCYEDASSPSAAVREYHRKFRRLTSMTQQLPFELTTPAVVKRVKKKISTIQQQVIGEPKQASSPSQSGMLNFLSSLQLLYH